MVYKENIVDRKIRFGIVGGGRIAQKHFQAIQENSSNAEIVAICDVNPKALEETSKELNAKPYSDLTSMLEDTNIDAVVLTTPSGLHANQAIQAARAGKHVISEKPMATRWADGLDMVNACDDAGVHLFVVKQNRYNPPLQLLKKAIDDGKFGKIYMVNVNVFWTRPQEYYDGAKWRGTWEYDGGAFMNQASHYFDLLPWLMGPVETVHAFTGTLARKMESEDTGVMTLKWRSGALGSVNVTMLTYPKNLEGSITILGEKGTVKIGGTSVNSIEHWEFENPSEQDQKISEGTFEFEQIFGHALYYKNVVSVLQGKESPQTDGREGLKSLELLTASYLSARDGQRISLPLEL